MKYMIKLFWVFCALSTLALMSNRSGRGSVAGEALTLAPGEGGRTCSNAGCHGTATPFGTEVSINLLDLAGNVVSNYEPGEDYRVNLTISATGASGYGFMIVCLDENDQAVNNWGSPPDDIRSINLIGRDYLEHTMRLDDNSYNFDWTAPTSGTGDVVFYAAGNAVNGNNSNSGDNANTTAVSFSENVMSSVDDLKRESALIFPNPVKDELHIIPSGNYTIEIMNIHGVIVQKLKSTTNEHMRIDLSTYAQGSYFVRILDNENRQIETKHIVKLD